MSNTVTILLADDHPVFRHGLKQIIGKKKMFEIVGEVSRGDEGMQKIRKLRPDIAVLDIDMPGLNGIEIALQVQNELIPTKIVILTMYNEQDMFNKAIDCGVYGYVLKESAVLDIIECIETVERNRYYISPRLSGYLIKRAEKQTAFQNKHSAIESLTPMERRILHHIALMKTSKAIAEELSISYRTVQNHRMNICNKLEIHGSNGLLKFALENKTYISI